MNGFIVGLSGRLSDYFREDDKDALIEQMLKNVSGERTLEAASGVEAGTAYTATGAAFIFDFPGKVAAGAEALARPYFVKKAMVLIQPTILFCLIFFFPLFFLISGYSFQSLLTYTMFTLAIKALPAILVVSNYLTNNVKGAAREPLFEIGRQPHQLTNCSFLLFQCGCRSSCQSFLLLC